METFFKDLNRLSIDLPFSGKVHGLKAQLIWQFLRWNKSYREGYDRLAKVKDSSGELPMLFAQSWCLSSAVDYELEKLPTEYDDEEEVDLSPHFKYEPIISFRDIDFLKAHGDLLLPEGKRIFVLNPMASRDQVLRVLSSKKKTAGPEYTLRGLSKSHLAEFAATHYYYKVKRMGPKELSPIYHRIFKTNLTSILSTAHLQNKIEGFHKVSEKSPWCFFTPSHR